MFFERFPSVLESNVLGDESVDVFILSENKRLLQNFMVLLTTYQLVIIFIGALVLLKK